MRPGVSADPRKEDSWEFINKELTEHEERMMIAMAVQIGVVAMMNTHQFSFNGKTFLQEGLEANVLPVQLHG